MYAILVLAMALSMPAQSAHPAPQPPATAATMSPREHAEVQAADAESATAYWTKMLAFATVLLGVITVGITVYDNVRSSGQRQADVRNRQAERDADAQERRDERDAADTRLQYEERMGELASLAQLEQVLWFFNRRCQQLEDRSESRAETLLRGLDAALTRALAADVARAISEPSLAEQVYAAIFEAHDTLVFALDHQLSSSGRTVNGDTAPSELVQRRAHASQLATEQAAKLVHGERERLETEWMLRGTEDTDEPDH